MLIVSAILNSVSEALLHNREALSAVAFDPCDPSITGASLLALCITLSPNDSHLPVPLVGTIIGYRIERVEELLPRRVRLPQHSPWTVEKVLLLEYHPGLSLSHAGGR